MRQVRGEVPRQGHHAPCGELRRKQHGQTNHCLEADLQRRHCCRGSASAERRPGRPGGLRGVGRRSRPNELRLAAHELSWERDLPCGVYGAIQFTERSEKSWRSQFMTPRVNSFAPFCSAIGNRGTEAIGNRRTRRQRRTSAAPGDAHPSGVRASPAGKQKRPVAAHTSAPRDLPPVRTDL